MSVDTFAEGPTHTHIHTFDGHAGWFRAKTHAKPFGGLVACRPGRCDLVECGWVFFRHPPSPPHIVRVCALSVGCGRNTQRHGSTLPHEPSPLAADGPASFSGVLSTAFSLHMTRARIVLFKRTIRTAAAKRRTQFMCYCCCVHCVCVCVRVCPYAYTLHNRRATPRQSENNRRKPIAAVCVCVLCCVRAAKAPTQNERNDDVT